MLGTDLRSRGGVAAVVNAYRDTGLFERANIRYLATHRDGGLLIKLATVVRTLVVYSCLLLGGRVKAIHVHTASRASFWRKCIFVLLAYARRVPVVLHLHGGEFHIFFERECGRLAKWLIRYVFDRADYVIVLSGVWKQRIAVISANPNIVCLPNPVHLPETVPDFDQREERTILFLGHLNRGKGIYDLIEAGSLLVRQGMQVRIIIGGTGEMEGVATHARKLGMEQHVNLRGWVERANKDSLLRQATVFALPSYNEGLPMSVLEAMAAGLPVVSTPVGGIPDAITPGAEGLLIAPGDVQGLAGALGDLLNDRARLRQMGERAREKASEVYAADRIVSRLEAIYAAAGARPPISDPVPDSK